MDRRRGELGRRAPAVVATIGMPRDRREPRVLRRRSDPASGGAVGAGSGAARAAAAPAA